MAKRGTPEEQKIAISIIDNLEISIEDSEIIEAEFIYTTKYEKMLIHQIAAMIINDFKPIYYTSKLRPKHVWYKITRVQQREIDLYYSIYRREIKEEFQITLHAFINRNNIFPLCELKNPQKPKKEDWEKNRKILDRAGTIDKTHIRKQIEI